MSRTEFLWWQKYRPSKIDDVVLPKAVKNFFKKSIADNGLQNMIFYGPPGAGKTTSAVVLCKELDADFILLNGSGEDRGVDTIKHKITDYASSMTLEGHARKIVIFDEADNLTLDAQLALRSTMERYSSTCGFILTCNHENRISEAIRSSRCVPVQFVIPANEKKELMGESARAMAKVLQAEGIEFSKEALKKIIIANFPDMRKTINILQASSQGGKLETVALAQGDGDASRVVEFLRKKDWTGMRKWVAEEVDDPLSVILWLWNRGDEIFAPKDYPLAVTFLNDAQRDDAIVVDKQLNLAACLTKLMVDVDTKGELS